MDDDAHHKEVRGRAALRQDLLLTWLTWFICTAWVVTFAFRIFHYTFEGSAIIDTALLLVLGFWFGNKALQPVPNRKNGDS